MRILAFLETITGSKTGSERPFVSSLGKFSSCLTVSLKQKKQTPMVLNRPLRLHFAKSAVHLRPLWAFSSAG